MVPENIYSNAAGGRRCKKCSLDTHYRKYRENHVVRLHRIPPEVAEAVYKRALQGGSQRQIASEFGISPSMVYRIKNNIGYDSGRRVNA